MSGRGDEPPSEAERVGLCLRCTHARRQASAKGAVFWLCQRARHDARFRRYPPLPVRACPGFAARDDPEDG